MKEKVEVEKKVYTVVNDKVEVYILKEFDKVANADVYYVHIRLEGYAPLMDCYGTMEKSFDDAFELFEGNLITYYQHYVEEFGD